MKPLGDLGYSLNVVHEGLVRLYTVTRGERMICDRVPWQEARAAMRADAEAPPPAAVRKHKYHNPRSRKRPNSLS